MSANNGVAPRRNQKKVIVKKDIKVGGQLLKTKGLEGIILDKMNSGATYIVRVEDRLFTFWKEELDGV